MRNLLKFLHANKEKLILIVFPHVDDESFVAGGFLQLIKRLGMKSKLITLTNGSKREDSFKLEQEYNKATSFLGINNTEIWKFKEGELNGVKKDWLNKLKKEIITLKPFAILTFDPNGITGHPDHIVTSIEILNLVKTLKGDKPHLLWRISDREEKNYFSKQIPQGQSSYNGKGLAIDKDPTFSYFLSLGESIKKLRAIFMYKSQLKNIFFKLRILDWYLFDHKELFYLADFEKDNFEVHFEKRP